MSHFLLESLYLIVITYERISIPRYKQHLHIAFYDGILLKVFYIHYDPFDLKLHVFNLLNCRVILSSLKTNVNYLSTIENKEEKL